MKVSGDNSISLYGIGDFHCGMKNSNVFMIQKAVKYIKDDPNEKRVYLMGDLLEVATKESWDAVYHEELRLEEQISLVLDLLRPIKEDIQCYCHGNHEDRLMKLLGFNVTRFVSQRLGCEYAIQYFDQIPYNGDKLTIFATHGKGWAQRPDTAVSKVYRDTIHIDADIIFYGHLHYPLSHKYYQKTADGLKERYLICTGHFLSGEVDYVEKKLIPPAPPSFVRVEVSGDKIHPQIIRF